ncbi:MAG TPA: VOC family protein [Solirubrobacterales bacterium]|nr:VOC family protein [Solirubrobacterales bacterium]
MGSIDHVDLVVSSLARSLPFYRGLLEPLGYTDVGDIEGERGERVVYLSRGGTLGAVGLRERQAREGEVFDRYALGLHHLAIAAPDREAVDRVGAWAEAEGIEIESQPKEYDYTPGYYALFLHDPDGLKLEVVHR